jgi:hypothetical protein
MDRNISRIVLLLCLSVPLASIASSGEHGGTIVLGQSILHLDGPWRFHTGDDPRWADTGFDDSSWESMDLSAPPDANDGDVGITPYTSGWSAKGHQGYQGYAWYRLRVTVTPPPGETLALLGPWDVDSDYQVFVDGVLLGGIGDFSGTTPATHGNYYPLQLELPIKAAQGGPMTLAIRVWAGPWTGNTAGIHVAPVIGEQEAITAQYRLQWLTIFKGYAVDVVPALLFCLMALMALCLWPLDHSDRSYPWLAAALVLSGMQRGNQAFFFWWQVETIQGFVIFILGFVASLSLGAWIMAWRHWFKLTSPAWLPKALAGLVLALILTQILGQPWLFGTTYPHALSLMPHYLLKCLRLAFLAAFLFTLYHGIRSQGREGWLALPAMLAIGVVLFPGELSALHVPGIWFPYGIGVSLSEICSVVFDLLLFALLLRRLWSRGRRAPVTTLGSRA